MNKQMLREDKIVWFSDTFKMDADVGVVVMSRFKFSNFLINTPTIYQDEMNGRIKKTLHSQVLCKKHSRFQNL